MVIIEKRGLRVLGAILVSGLAGLALQPAVAQDGSKSRVIYGVPAPQTGESNNPNRDLQASEEFQLKPMYENLIGVDPKTSEWIPMLAESWEISDARDKLTFHLRKGVQFQKGWGEMTAEDVIFSFNDATYPEGALTDLGRILRGVSTKIEATDDYTVVLHLKPGLGLSFFEVISYGAAGGAIKSKADWDSRGGGTPATPKLDEEPIAGTGPYQFVSRTPGQSVLFEKVPYDHWRKNADFDEIEYKFIEEDATRLSALLADEIDITSLPKELAAEAARQGDEIIRSALPGRRFGMALEGCYYKQEWKEATPSAEVFTSDERLYPDSPWCDRDLRIAANKAVDRQALIDAFYGGEAEIAHMWYWLPEQTASWNPEWDERFDEHIGYDPEGAREILAKYDSPVNIQVWVKDDITEAIAGMLQDVGFEVEYVSMDRGQQRAKRTAREFDRMIDLDDSASENITGFEPNGYANQDSKRAVENLEWDILYEKIAAELDPAKRAQMWRKLGDEIFDAAPNIPLFRTYTEVVVNPKKVCGYTFPGANMSDEFSFVEYIQKC